MEYVAHDEDGELGEAFGNMPIVGAIQKANPTPYKKKKVPPAAGGKKKKKGSGSKGVVEEEEEFDSRKLRKKWKYLDGQDAYLWDDVNEDTGDQSKCFSQRTLFRVPINHGSCLLCAFPCSSQRSSPMPPPWKEATFLCPPEEENRKAK